MIFLIFQNPAVILPIFYRDFNTSLRMTSNCKDTQTTLPVNNCKVISLPAEKNKDSRDGRRFGCSTPSNRQTDRDTFSLSLCPFVCYLHGVWHKVKSMNHSINPSSLNWKSGSCASWMNKNNSDVIWAWTIRRQTNSRSVKSRTTQLADSEL